MKEAQKRDFIDQMLQLLEEENASLAEAGYSSEVKKTVLTEKNATCNAAEMAQQQAAAKAKEATTFANSTLNDAYKEASNLADAISGLLGKDNEIVKKMRQFRN